MGPSDNLLLRYACGMCCLLVVRSLRLFKEQSVTESVTVNDAIANFEFQVVRHFQKFFS